MLNLCSFDSAISTAEMFSNVWVRKMDLQEVGGGCGDWMELVQDRDG